jgi:hypothetical protein
MRVYQKFIDLMIDNFIVGREQCCQITCQLILALLLTKLSQINYYFEKFHVIVYLKSLIRNLFDII